MNFIALDVETANADFASICSIGLVHFRAGEVFKSLTILVNPEDHFDAVNISIHGIEPEHVANSPTMEKVFPAIASQLKDVAVIHHSSFDRVALSRAATKYGLGELPCNWIDTTRVARRAWPKYSKSGYGLANIAKDFGITFQHHDAAEDARVAGLIMVRAMAESGLGIDEWRARCERPINSYENDRVTQSGNPLGPLAGEVIAFTGRLQIPRAEAARLAAQIGCDVADSVTKATTILVVGDQDVRALNGEEKSAKHRKAEAMIRKGAMLKIIGETDFRLMTEQA
jgi:DNA polymerase-3 subunit epsilon